MLYKITDLVISKYNYLYITCFNKFNKNYLFGYTLNGIMFSYIQGNINNIEFTPSGNLIIGYYENLLQIVYPIDFSHVIFKKQLNDVYDDVLYYYNRSEDNIYLHLAYFNGQFKKVPLCETDSAYFA